MKYLLDTNVVSEMRKAGTTKIAPSVATWFESIPTTSCYLSVVTILELEIGILGICHKDKTQGDILRRWFEKKVLPTFENRILAIDKQIALACAHLHVPDRKPERDALLAATALVHNMILVTRNIKDFTNEDIRVLNPWDAASHNIL